MEGNKNSLSDLRGDSTAEKAAAYIRELQSRRLETHQMHRAGE